MDRSLVSKALSLLLTAVVAGCGSGGSASNGGASQGTTAEGSPSGGTIALAGVGSVQLGAGAIAQPLAITVRAVDPAVPLPAAAVSKVVAFTPHGTQFEVPARISLSYSSSSPVSRLAVLRLADDAAAEWTAIGGVHFSGGVASFETTSFSTYAVTDGFACQAAAATNACGTACGIDGFCTAAASCVQVAKATLCESKVLTVIQGELPDLAVVSPQQTTDSIHAATLSAALAARCGSTVARVPQAQPGILDPCTDAPLLKNGDTVLLIGGTFSQRLARWLEQGHSPILFTSDAEAGRTRFLSRVGTILHDYPNSDLTPRHDYFVIALIADPARGALIMHVYGMGWEGTPAATWYFVNRVLPKLAANSRSFKQYVLVEWTDDGDGVKGAADTWKILAQDVP